MKRLLLVAAIAAMLFSLSPPLPFSPSSLSASAPLRLPSWAASDATPSPDGRPYYVVDLPKEQRQRFRNPDGSCVQCSIGMVGVAVNVPQAELLLWDSKYGKAVRGGSHPERVQQYCDARGIPAYNVYGNEALEWVNWSLASGRPCAITWGTNHMITAVGYSHAPGTNAIDAQSYYAVCDNNSPQRIDWYSAAEFRRRFAAFGGGWCVVLKTPPAAGPHVYTEWWK